LLVPESHCPPKDYSSDCPKDGVHAVKMPWEVRPKTHFTALFEAQVIVMALSGMSVVAIAHLVHETAHAHMEAAGQGRDRGKGCRRLLGCRARRDRRHRQKVQPKLH